MNLWWAIPGVLGGMPIPYIHPERRLNQGGELRTFMDELPVLHDMGIRAVACLLNIPSDESVYRSAGFAFQCLPVPDGYPPSLDQVLDFVQFVDRCRSEQKPVAVHCEAGVGRTGTMLAAYLIAKGSPPAEAIRCVRSQEPVAVETARQISFLENLPLLFDKP